MRRIESNSSKTVIGQWVQLLFAVAVGLLGLATHASGRAPIPALPSLDTISFSQGPSQAGPFTPPAAEPAWRETAQGNLAASEYRASPTPHGLQAPNRAHGLRTYFESSCIRLHERSALDGDALATLTLKGFGRGSALVSAGKGEVSHRGSRVEIARPGITEWYENSERGLEQGFDVDAPPPGEGPLVVELDVGRATASLQGDFILLNTQAGRRLRYSKLVAWDAWGHPLASRLEVRSKHVVRLVVEDQGAAYPIVIDPLITAVPDATLESNHVWSGSFDSAMFGHSVESAGDVNADGYADIVVGAYGWDLAGGLFDEGAAFVFLGSPDGIVGTDPATAHAVLLGDQAAAEFGTSVAGAGDVNGDGFSDIVIGAPAYSSPTVQGGAAFVFLGSPAGIIGTGPANAHASIFGNDAELNLGRSVASAGDVNNDGFDDILLAAPPGPRSIGGATLVFHGSPAGITGTGVGDANRVILHASGALLGRMAEDVAGAGDVNGDGFDDVLVSASDSTDGRYAMVFHGSPAGITGTTPASASHTITGDATVDLSVELSGAGDINGDGFDDILLADEGYPTGITSGGHGAFMLFHGSAAGITATTASAADTLIEGDLPIVVLGPVQALGRRLAPAGDIDGDGFGDILVGGFEYPGSLDNEGVAYVFRGSASGLVGSSLADAYVRLETGQAGGAQRNRYGLDVASAGDVNGDGFADVLMGAGLYDAGETDEGVVFVYHGGSGSGGPVNQHPVAYAGTDQSVQDADGNGSEEITLDGSASFDPDGSIVSYEWFKGSTPLGAGAVLTTVLPTVGTQSVSLVVTDDGGKTASDGLTVRVEPPADVFVQEEFFSSELGNWVVGGDISTIPSSGFPSGTWAQIGASGAFMRLPVAMPAGSTGMKLRFWGKASQFGASDQLIFKASVDGGPFATFDTLMPQDEGLNNDAMSFYGGSVGHGPVSATWVPASASNVVVEIRSEMNSGVFTIGGSIEVRALIGNPSPVANAGPDQSATDADGNGSESFTLDGSGSSDPDGSIVSYEWRDGAALLGSTASLVAPLSAGVHTVVLTVTDDGGETASDSAVITVDATGCTTHAECDDGVFCNGAEICDPVLDCQAGTPLVVDDSVACTVDACDEFGDALTHVPDAGTCDDGDPCTAEICDATTGCSNVAVEGCAVSVPSGGPGGTLLLGLLLLATALREIVFSPRAARSA
jgi:hypothetical protein